MDKLSTVDRSRNMSAIRGRNTKPELLMRQWIFAKGYRYRINVKYIPGHPDIFLRKYNTAIFVNGCFWHRHNKCKYAYIPKSNIEFWSKKFENNIKRDDEVRIILADEGIKQLTIWECTVKKMAKDIDYKNKVLNMIENFFACEDQILEI